MPHHWRDESLTPAAHSAAPCGETGAVNPASREEEWNGKQNRNEQQGNPAGLLPDENRRSGPCPGEIAEKGEPEDRAA